MANINQISDFKVMKSNAGYYIGRSEFQADINLSFPYSRDSQYYPSKEIAEKHLKYFKLIDVLH